MLTADALPVTPVPVAMTANSSCCATPNDAANGVTLPIEAASSAYEKAEDVLVDDLPAAPLFHGVDQTVWTKRVSGIHYSIVGEVVLQDVEVHDAAVEGKAP